MIARGEAFAAAGAPFTTVFSCGPFLKGSLLRVVHLFLSGTDFGRYVDATVRISITPRTVSATDDFSGGDMIVTGLRFIALGSTVVPVPINKRIENSFYVNVEYTIDNNLGANSAGMSVDVLNQREQRRE